MDKDIILHFRDIWSRMENTFVRGRSFVQEKFLEGEDLAEYFEKNEIESSVKCANGFWGLVQKYENSIIMAADRLRSYPVFYGICAGTVYVSDDAYWVKENLNEDEVDEVSRNEFLLTGYVTGRNTLYKGVKQIQPGEIIYIYFDENEEFKIKTKRYYDFIHKDYFENLPRGQLLKLHETSLFNSIKRLVQYAAGRTIVIPLSGGYDSRLVAAALKKFNYKKVVTFSYGKLNNPESIKSREVAERLNFKWIFIPYDNENAFNWYNSELRKDFSRYADNLSNVLPDREWPAVMELKRLELIPEDSVFVPGHSGDFISGGHIPLALCTMEPGKEELVDEILKKHYVMWSWKGVESKWKGDFSKKILECAEGNDCSTDSAANMYEKWNWQENQIKRMANSVKIYDFFGYEYWLPLWDYEYMDFWCRIPLYYRVNKNLYDEYVVALYAESADISLEEAKESVPAIESSSILTRLLRKSKNVISNKKTKLSRYEIREEDWEQSSGRMTMEIYNILLPYIIGRTSCTTIERLGLISFTEKTVPESTLNMLKEMKEKGRA